MTNVTKLMAWCTCLAAFAGGRAAFADFTGLVTQFRSESVCEDIQQEYINYKLDVCNLYATFNDTSDRILSVGFSSISTTATQGFYQHPFGGDRAPNCALVQAIPDVVCDSFVTMGLDCNDGSDFTALDPSFGFSFSNAFGGWFNGNPPGNQGAPDANGLVLIGQFSYKKNKNTSGVLSAFVELAGSQQSMEYPLETFDCSTGTTGGGGTAGSSGGGAPLGGPIAQGGGGAAQGGGGCVICYVKPGGTGNCSSWLNACGDLQIALFLASPPVNSCDQIWVAAGTYAPTGPAGSRTETFQLLDGVAIYGGFDGMETKLEDRDFVVNVTTLTGDVAGNDASFGNGDNSFHVVTGSGTVSTAILDGFTITAGNANGVIPLDEDKGAGMLNILGSPTVANCIFDGNSCLNLGGGMYNDASTSAITNCTFIGNSSTNSSGGGIYNWNTPPTALIDNCTFTGNTAAGGGGGMCNNFFSAPTISNCLFQDNTALYGGGMGNNGASSPTVSACDFIGNSASSSTLGGGAIASENNSSPQISGCLFSGNTALGSDGGAMWNESGSSPQVSNCQFVGNAAGNGASMANDNDSNPTITNCTFTHQGVATDPFFGGIYNVNASPIVIGCDFTESDAAYGPGISFKGQSSCASPPCPAEIINCKFTGNFSTNKGGAVYLEDESPGNGAFVKLTNCIFSGNSTFGDGGALSVDNSSAAIVTNCSFSQNSADSAGHFGGAIAVEDSTCTIDNCIMWDNTADTDGPELHVDATSAAVVDFSDVEGGEAGVGGTGRLTWGDGNIGELPADNPDFVDPDGLDNILGTADDDLRLLALSPCIDAADNAKMPSDAFDLDGDGNTTEPTPIDLDPKPRFIQDPATVDCPHVPDPAACGDPPIVDMGAYEFAPPCPTDCPTDFDGDGDTDAADLADLLACWGDLITVPGCLCKDFDEDLDIDSADLAEILAAWGTCP